MDLFVPYPSFTRSVEALAHDELVAARYCALQVVRALWERQPPGGERWVRLFADHGGSAVQYARATDELWRRRVTGPRGTDFNAVRDWLTLAARAFPAEQWRDPDWLGDASFHAAERDRLRRMNSAAYTGLSDVSVATNRGS